MTPRLWFLIAAIACAAGLVVIDLSWIDVDGNQHLPAWLGLSLIAFYVSTEVKR